MRVRIKLILILLFVALVPLGVAAFTSLSLYQDAYEARLREARLQLTRDRATIVEHLLENAGQRIASVALQIPWPTLTPAERAGALSLVYQQMDDIAVTLLLDEQGDMLGEAILVTDDTENVTGHPSFPPDLLQRVVEQRAAPTVPGSWHLGRAHFVQKLSDAPLVPITISVTDQTPSLTLLVGLSLRAMCRDSAGSALAGLDFTLLDERGHELCSNIGASEVGSLVPSLPERDAEPRLFKYRHDDGQTMLAAVANVGPTWRLVARQPAALADRPGQVMQRQVILWLSIGLLIALIAGWYLAKGLSEPLTALTEGAAELARGNTEHRVLVTGRDEFGRLAATFNHMSAEIHRRDQKIRTWNKELEQRVAERTRELADAQQLLIQSHTVAAMSSLAAGMAHEINNPLTTVFGMSQLMQKRAAKIGLTARDVRALELIETEAARIRDIVATLQSLVESTDGESFDTVDTVALIEQVVAVMNKRIDDAGLTLSCQLEPTLPHLWGRESQLREVLIHLLTNAITATDAGGRVEIAAHAVGDRLLTLTVTDTGSGIPGDILDRVFEPFFTTKGAWQGQGLGLTIVHRVIEEHQGKVAIASEAGQGTTVTVTVPIFKRGTHLV